jgi:hypothetical protein
VDKLISNLPAILAVTFIFGGWVIAWIVHSIATNWRKARESEHLAALKQSMIERGMSAEEIERVINAGRKPEDGPTEKLLLHQRERV